jgi:uncharacterized protein DUF6314
MTAAQELFAGLAGRWRLTRSIEPGIGTAQGLAVFTPDGPGRLRYREDVELRLTSGHVGPAYRENTYVLEADGIRVLLADGTTMHTLPLTGSGPASDVHPCRADEYRGVYDFEAAGGAWTVDMHVTGPDKDYRMHTRYERL